MSAYNGTHGRGETPARSRIGIDVEGLAGFLRSRHPSCTAQHVEADTGIPARTVEGWLELRSAPSLMAFLVLAHQYGPAFAAAAYKHAPRWLDESKAREEEIELEAMRAEIDRRLEEMRQGQ